MTSDRHPEPTPAAQTAVPTAAKRRSNTFFRKQSAQLSRDDARRQGNISQLAYLALGGKARGKNSENVGGSEAGRDAAIAFLNTDSRELGGRPLAIATASDEGYARIAAVIRARAAAPVTS